MIFDDHHPAADSLGSLPSSRLQIGWHNDVDFACQSVGALGSGSVIARTIKLSTLRMNRIPFRCLMSRSFFRDILRLSGRLVDVSIAGAKVEVLVGVKFGKYPTTCEFLRSEMDETFRGTYLIDAEGRFYTSWRKTR